MVTISQIKAARSLLEWKQSDLAAQAGLSLASIANLEQNKSSPRPKTMQAVQAAFENSGIEFTPDPGVRLRRQKFQLQVLEGHQSIIEIWADMEQALAQTGGEILLSGLDERIWIKRYKSELKQTLERRKNLPIITRGLVCEGDYLLVIPADHCRAIPKILFQQTPYYVYADKVAIINWETPQRVLLIQNPLIADMFRKQFEFNWSIGKKLDPKKVVIASLD